MRLTELEKNQIIQAVEQHISPTGAELRLYGSRTDPKQKGGDIDLLFIVPNDQLYQEALDKKLDIVVTIKQFLGDQKIDFTLAKVTDLISDPFIQLIMPKSLVLKRWA